MNPAAASRTSSGRSEWGEWPQRGSTSDSAGPPTCTHDGFDLPDRAVLVVFALHHQDRARDRRQVLLDVPLDRTRGEPHVGPPPEHRVGVAAVIPGEPIPEVRRLVIRRDSRDPLDGYRLHEHVRRLDDQRADGAGMGAGMDQRDRRAVAVSENTACSSSKCPRTAGRTSSASSCMYWTGRSPRNRSDPPYPVLL